MIEHFLQSLLVLVEEMSPYLLLGFLIAGILHAFVPRSIYHRYLGKSTTGSVLNALLFGIPLPLCSCGVIPTAVGMRKDGASKGATTAFLIGTPQTGIDSILATYSILGLPFAILRPLVALITGLFGGIACNLLEKEQTETDNAHTAQKKSEKLTDLSFPDKCKSAFEYGFTEMLIDIGRWLVLGLLLAGLITVFVPDDFFTSYQDNYLLNMLIVLVIASPMYVCATGSIPIAAALMLKGLSPGAALVFLMAGPATNMASIMVLNKTLGKRTLIIYLLSILVGAVGFGIFIDAALPATWFSTISSGVLHSSCCHEEMHTAPWWQIVSTIVFILLLLRALVLRYTTHRHCQCSEGGCCCHDDDGDCCCHDDNDDCCHCHKEESLATPRTFLVDGMMCNHCRNHVQEAIEHVEGVTSVNVDLASGTALVTGSAPDETIINAIAQCGYKCKLK